MAAAKQARRCGATGHERRVELPAQKRGRDGRGGGGREGSGATGHRFVAVPVAVSVGVPNVLFEAMGVRVAVVVADPLFEAVVLAECVRLPPLVRVVDEEEDCDTDADGVFEAEEDDETVPVFAPDFDTKWVVVGDADMVVLSEVVAETVTEREAIGEEDADFVDVGDFDALVLALVVTENVPVADAIGVALSEGDTRLLAESTGESVPATDGGVVPVGETVAKKVAVPAAREAEAEFDRGAEAVLDADGARGERDAGAVAEPTAERLALGVEEREGLSGAVPDTRAVAAAEADADTHAVALRVLKRSDTLAAREGLADLLTLEALGSAEADDEPVGGLEAVAG